MGKISSIYKMATIYSAADIFVIPSRIESFGQTAAEAQSCGTPVVGFDIGGLSVLTYKEMLYGYAKNRGLKKLIILCSAMSAISSLSNSIKFKLFELVTILFDL